MANSSGNSQTEIVVIRSIARSQVAGNQRTVFRLVSQTATNPRDVRIASNDRH
jgi:hypothetical protein